MIQRSLKVKQEGWTVSSNSGIYHPEQKRPGIKSKHSCREPPPRSLYTPVSYYGGLTESITGPAKYVTVKRETTTFPGASGPFPDDDVIRS